MVPDHCVKTKLNVKFCKSKQIWSPLCNYDICKAFSYSSSYSGSRQGVSYSLKHLVVKIPSSLADCPAMSYVCVLCSMLYLSIPQSTVPNTFGQIQWWRMSSEAWIMSHHLQFVAMRGKLSRLSWECYRNLNSATPAFNNPNNCSVSKQVFFHHKRN